MPARSATDLPFRKSLRQAAGLLEGLKIRKGTRLARGSVSTEPEAASRARVAPNAVAGTA